MFSLKALGSNYLLMQHHIAEKWYPHLYLPCLLSYNYQLYHIRDKNLYKGIA